MQSKLTNPTSYHLSHHAELRLAERTEISCTELLEQLSQSAFVWLPGSAKDGTRYAAIYCPQMAGFLMAIIAPDGAVKTVLTLEQFEDPAYTGRVVPDTWLLLAKHVALQSSATGCPPAHPLSDKLPPGALVAHRAPEDEPQDEECYLQVLLRLEGSPSSAWDLLGFFSSAELLGHNLPHIPLVQPLSLDKRKELIGTLLQKPFFKGLLLEALKDSEETALNPNMAVVIGPLCAEPASLTHFDISGPVRKILKERVAAKASPTPKDVTMECVSSHKAPTPVPAIRPGHRKLAALGILKLAE